MNESIKSSIQAKTRRRGIGDQRKIGALVAANAFGAVLSLDRRVLAADAALPGREFIDKRTLNV